MFGFNLAIVTKVVPEKHGVFVAYRNGVEHRDGRGDGYGSERGEGDSQAFVRVLERRAHSHGGTTICLPEVGEMGLVAEVEPGLTVWMGSLPWEGQNQMDPRPGLECWRHPSGVEIITTEDGDFQFAHPTGLVITIAALDGGQVPHMQGSTPLDQRKAAGGDFPHLIIDHPSGFKAHLDSIGNLKVDSPSALEGNFDGHIAVTTQSSASLTAVGPISAATQSSATLTAVGPISATTQSTLSASAVGDATVHTDAKLDVSSTGDATIHTDANLEASAGGDVAVTAGGKADITASSNCTVKAATVILDAPIVQCTGILQVAGMLQPNGGFGTTAGGANGMVPGNLWVEHDLKSDTLHTITEATIHAKVFTTHRHTDVQPGSSNTGVVA